MNKKLTSKQLWILALLFLIGEAALQSPLLAGGMILCVIFAIIEMVRERKSKQYNSRHQ